MARGTVSERVTRLRTATRRIAGTERHCRTRAARCARALAQAALHDTRLRLLRKMWSLGSAAIAALKCVIASSKRPAEKASLPLVFASCAAAFDSGLMDG